MQIVSPDRKVCLDPDDITTSQNDAAESRLLALEDRIQKLQMLEGRMMDHYTSVGAHGAAGNPVDAEPVGFALPNAPMTDESYRSPGADRKIATTGEFLNHSPTLRGSVRGAETAPGPLGGESVSVDLLRSMVRAELRQNLQDLNVGRQSASTSPTRKGKDTKRPKSSDSDSTDDDIIPPATKDVLFNVDDRFPRQDSPLKVQIQEPNQEPETSALNQRHRVQRERVSKPATLDEAVAISCPYLLGGFHRRNPVREFCFHVQTSIYWQALFVIITISNSVYIATAPGYSDELSISVSWYFDLTCACIFGFEVISGVIAYGACRGKTTYLRNDSFHTIDMLCLAFIVLEYSLASWKMWPNLTFRPFRMIRIIKPLTHISAFRGIKFILLSLTAGMPQISTLFGVLFLTIMGWIVLAMTVYGKSFRRRCVTIDTLVPACASDFSTGFNATCNFKSGVRLDTIAQPGGETAVTDGYPFESGCKIIATEHERDVNGNWAEPKPAGRLVSKGYYDFGQVTFLTSWPKDANGVYHSCQADLWREAQKRGDHFEVTQTCRDFGPDGNPQEGYAHFDNLWGATTCLAQVIIPNGYSDVWSRAIESEPDVKIFTMILFPFISVINTFLLLGMFVAVVTGSFKRIKEEHDYNQFSDDVLNADDSIISTPSPLKDAASHQRLDSADEAVEIQDEFQQIQNVAKQISRHWIWIHFVHLTIVWHLYSIGGEQYGSTEFWKGVYDWSNFGCSIVFILEAVLHALALGSKKYWARYKVQFILVIISIIGLSSGNTIVKAICSLRGYRLLKYFQTVEDLLTSARSSILSIVNVSMFAVVIGFCFTVVGRYLFGDKMNDLSRSNFGSLSVAALTMFQLFTGDSWSKVMYNAMQSMPRDDLLSQGASAFFVLSWFLFASLVINNLFVSVILENFRIQDTIDRIAEPGNLAYVRSQMKLAYAHIFAKTNAVLGGSLTLDANTGRMKSRNAASHVLMQSLGTRAAVFDLRDPTQLERGLITNPQGLYEKRSKTIPPIMKAVQSVTLLQPYIPEEERNMPIPERVLFMFEPDSYTCRIFAWLGRQFFFDTTVMVCILCSCFFLIIDPPYRTLEPNPVVSYAIMDLLNFVFTVVFSVEFLVRILGQGLLFTDGAYLKSGWNQVDTLVLVFAWLEQVGFAEGGTAKVLRMGKAMRPLRLMKRNASMRLIIDALIGTLRPLVYVMTFLFFTLVIFSCIAIGMFRGRLFRCNDPSLVYPQGKRECSGVWFTDNGIMMSSSWENPYWFNFDSFAASMMSLFQVTCFKFVHILWACMDATQEDFAPEEGASSEASIFFVVYILLGSVFTMNLFIGFVVDAFKANKGMSELEIIYRRYVRQLKQSKPIIDTFQPPSNAVSAAFRRLLQSHTFQTFSTTCVMVNVGFMLADNADSAGTEYGKMMDLQNFIFFWELVAEVALGIVAYGPGGLYNDSWRCFDMLVCVGTSLGYISQNDTMVSFARMFRLARVVRLMIRFKQIRIILDTMVRTLPQLLNVMLLLSIVFTMCAVLGVQMFATTKYGYRLGPTANFDHFAPALKVIWLIILGDEWMIMLADCAVTPPYCTSEVPGQDWNDCGSLESSFFFFITVKVVCEFIMLNLFIGLIIDNFSYITEDVGHQEDDRWTEGPSLDQLSVLREVFQRYDGGTGHVPITSLHCMLCDLGAPLGLKKVQRKRTLMPERVHLTEMDRILEHMIRAELNLCIRSTREVEASNAKSLRYQLGLKPLQKRKLFLHGVSYEDFFLTVTFWRFPQLLPAVVKWQRQERVQEVAHIAAALTVVDFFRTVGARRKRKKIQAELTKLKKFDEWAKENSHRRRWEDNAYEARTSQRQHAKENQVPVGLLLPEPNSSLVLVAQYLELESHDMPEEMVFHSKAVKDLMGKTMKVPQPINGIEILKKMCEDHVLVLEALDPNYEEVLKVEIQGQTRPQFIVADLGQFQWRGWRATNARNDTFFGPSTFSGFDVQGRRFVPESWNRLDLFLRAMGSTTGKKGKRKKRMGSVLDFQSYIEEDKTSTATKLADRAVSHLSMNLGNFLYSSEKVKHELQQWTNRQRTAKQKLQKLANHRIMSKPSQPIVNIDTGGVLKVCGYLPRDVYEDKYMGKSTIMKEDHPESSSSSDGEHDFPLFKARNGSDHDLVPTSNDNVDLVAAQEAGEAASPEVVNVCCLCLSQLHSAPSDSQLFNTNNNAFCNGLTGSRTSSSTQAPPPRRTRRRGRTIMCLNPFLHVLSKPGLVSSFPPFLC